MFNGAFEAIDVDTGGAIIHCVHGGKGPPLLLLHGYPQTHMIWHEVAPVLAEAFHVICPDLRGYGDSSKPAGEADHANYSKRAMAQDMAELMIHFGYERFAVAGHDRGARVTHRLALDYPERVRAACVMDIAPTLHMFDHTDQAFATGYYHWFFLIQPDGLPEHMIGLDPDYYLGEKLKRWSAPGATFSPRAVAEYSRCFGDPAAIHASCEDYRAAAGIDLEHDRADRLRKLACPLLVLWGNQGFVHRTYDLLAVWRDYAEDVRGFALESGHFLPEETPQTVINALRDFFTAESK
ncbi:alpha/beta hydrolase [Marinobacterium sp. D7]|uniref:alpha/beta fold hydrolase n=1 Tax=Marinobacterium ramblicola TaxID=2849041 RepID=UPI001C2CE5B2|nr:alpha/beta hydrolase [Marinobacterium ramblicola]MBV1789499.1 alpha/beta hydrolase [Marinobacterium ramblicola]